MLGRPGGGRGEAGVGRGKWSWCCLEAAGERREGRLLRGKVLRLSPGGWRRRSSVTLLFGQSLPGRHRLCGLDWFTFYFAQNNHKTKDRDQPGLACGRGSCAAQFLSAHFIIIIGYVWWTLGWPDTLWTLCGSAVSTVDSILSIMAADKPTTRLALLTIKHEI